MNHRIRMMNLAYCAAGFAWGEDEQIKAENAFFDMVNERLPLYAQDDLYHYCVKATTDEMIEAAFMHLARHPSINNPFYAGESK